jgi:hypothetical protein
MRGLNWVTPCADTLSGTADVRDAYRHLLFSTVVEVSSTSSQDSLV